jgi:hypothetical protein
MKGTKLLGAVLLVVGILALAYGGFSYTKDTDKVNIGLIHLEVKDKERVNIPLWAGVAVAIVGGVLLARKDWRPGRRVSATSGRVARPLHLKATVTARIEERTKCCLESC